ncbi:MAG: hypothetical protein GC150_03280 [Rhizobiales bacterium]|nr:hypothetical protein [Hyphomicrobiales bacterium]
MIRKTLLATALLAMSAVAPALAASISPAGLSTAIGSDTAATPLVQVHGSHTHCAWGPVRGWWHRHGYSGARACTPSRRFDDGDGIRRRGQQVHRDGGHYRRHVPLGDLVILDPPKTYYPARPSRPYIVDDYYGYNRNHNRHDHYGRYGYGTTPQRCAKDWHCEKSGPFGLKKNCYWRMLCN